MQLSKKTLNILKHFNTLNPSVLISAGKVQKTISSSKKTMVEVVTEEDFPVTFGVYELSKFLGAISFFKDAEIDFGDSSLKVVEQDRVLEYVYASPDAILRPPTKEIVVEADAEFNLPWKVLSDTLSAAKVLGAGDIELAGDGTHASIRALDSRNTSSHTFRTVLGPCDKEFKLVFKSEALNFMEADYAAKVSFTKLAQFNAEGIEYKVAAESAGGKK